MFVVAGVNGNTGKVVAQTLLAQQLPVRVLVRSAEKGAAWKRAGAEVHVADVSDAASLTAALDGATAAYLLSPPDFSVTDFREQGKKVAEAQRRALESSKVQHAVFLSSNGAQLAQGTGPVVGLFEAERVFKQCAVPVTVLRPAYFMENILGSLDAMRSQRMLPSFLSANVRIAMVATADIGAQAASLLRHGQTAERMVELAGPSEYSFADVGVAFGRALKQAVQVVEVPAAQHFATFKSFGMPEVYARGYVELNAVLSSGSMIFESTPRRGLISIDAFASRAVSAPTPSA
jgi:uncharacterized protein YbjT (DUF2867 family)